MERLIESSVFELQRYLVSQGIPVHTWGQGESKTLGHLLHELETGESCLQESEDGRIFRLVTGVGINVLHQNSRGLLKLHEDRQVFADGRVRKRDLPTSIGEKMTPGETPYHAAWRALSEELGISARGLEAAKLTVVNNERVSTSFPGLTTRNTIFVYPCQLTQGQFKPEGYIEKQPDKTSFFVWKELSNGNRP